MSALLLDSHVLLWFASDESRLSKKALKALLNGENQLWLSVASIWEISIKISLKRLKLKESLRELVDKQIEINRLQILHVEPQHAYATERLPFHHRDPFDRLLVAQATCDKLKIVSSDELLSKYHGVERLW